MKNPGSKKPISARKRAAILANLAKARAAPRSPASYARSRHNATRHGLFVRHLEGSFVRLGEDPRVFHKLRALLTAAFAPTDATEISLVGRLAAGVWRHLRAYHAAARWELEALSKAFGALPRQSLLGPILTRARASTVMLTLMDEQRFSKRSRLALGEVERTLRRLLMYRTDNPDAKFHFVGRRYRNEALDLCPDPGDWARRYAAAVPLKK